MKVKKVNELKASEYSEDQLNDFRSRRFSIENDIEYHIYGEDLKFNIPEYIKLQTFYSMEDVFKWYKTEMSNKISRIHKYDNILLVKESSKSEFSDLKLEVDINKYNL